MEYFQLFLTKPLTYVLLKITCLRQTYGSELLTWRANDLRFRPLDLNYFFFGCKEKHQARTQGGGGVSSRL